jgi:hypothetical protein
MAKNLLVGTEIMMGTQCARHSLYHLLRLSVGMLADYPRRLIGGRHAVVGISDWLELFDEGLGVHFALPQSSR